MWLAPHPHRLKIQMTLLMHSTKFPLPIALPLHPPRVMKSFYFLVLMTLILFLFQTSLTRTFLLLLFPILLLLFVPFVSYLESKKYVHDARVYAMTTTIWNL